MTRYLYRPTARAVTLGLAVAGCILISSCSSSGGSGGARSSPASTGGASTATSRVTDSVVAAAPTTRTASAPGAACALLPAAQVSTVFGLAVTPGEQDQGPAQVCRYLPANRLDGSVVVSVFTAGTSDFELALKNQPVPGVPVAGVGERASVFTGEGTLIAYRAGRVVSVQLIHRNLVMGTAAELKSLATIAVSRL